MRDHPTAAHDERGSTLLLVPSAAAVLLILLALVLDGSATFLAQRQLADACAGAANDGATGALTRDALRRDLPAAYDEAQAAELATRRVASLGARWGRPVEVGVSTDGTDLVVQLRGRTRLPIGAPGGRSTTTVTATCRATAVRR